MPNARIRPPEKRRYKYSERDAPLRGQPATVWLVEETAGKRRRFLMVVDTAFTAEEVWQIAPRHCSRRGEEPFTHYRVGRVDVGTFEVAEVITLFTGDSRKINERKEIEL